MFLDRVIPLLLTAAILAGCFHQNIQTGDKVPTFTLTDLDGNEVGTGPSRGTILVMTVVHLEPEPLTNDDFSAKQSRQALQDMKELYAKHSAAPVDWLVLGYTGSRAGEEELRELRDWVGEPWPYAATDGLYDIVSAGIADWIIEEDGTVHCIDARCYSGVLDDLLAERNS